MRPDRIDTVMRQLPKDRLERGIGIAEDEYPIWGRTVVRPGGRTRRNSGALAVDALCIGPFRLDPCHER
jgi:hypothetical protein